MHSHEKCSFEDTTKKLEGKSLLCRKSDQISWRGDLQSQIFRTTIIKRAKFSTGEKSDRVCISTWRRKR